jgi:DNA-binding HxlR family transcriptional regulator
MGAPDGIDVDIDREAVASFLERKGSFEVLIIISEGGAQFTEIFEQLQISSDTLTKRLKEGVAAGVIADESKRVDGERKNIYVLTPLGLAVRERMHEARVGEVFWRLMELREQFEKLEEDVTEYVEDTDSPLEQRTVRMMMKEGLDEPRDAREYFWESY